MSPADYRIKGIPFPLLRRFQARARAEGLDTRQALIACMVRYTEGDESLLRAIKASHRELQQSAIEIARGPR